MSRLYKHGAYLFYILALVASIVFLFRARNHVEGYDEQKPERIAMIFSGRIKGYGHVLHKLQTIVNTYNPVIFCSLNETVYTDEIARFCNDLNIPKSQVNIEQTVLPTWSNKCNLINPVLHVYSMFYHQNKAFKLIEEYQKSNFMTFDSILYYRADMNSTDTLTLAMPSKNTVYLPNDRGYGGYNDRMAYGDYDSMKIYCRLVDSFESLCATEQQINAEGMLRNYLSRNHINIITLKYNTDLHEKRNEKVAMGILDK
ncbi:MAG: hypothetical protein EB127_21955 [Alphaproteobacteria bacterium]|nr:hypothetical protein [Alphaproteobacteria bacterium]